MDFSHHPDIWSRFPELSAHTLFVRGIGPDADVKPHVDRFDAITRQRLSAVASEGDWPEVNAWRRVFSRMGLKPTQYRCASESLLRRFRKEGGLPAIHPLIDLCNAASMAFGLPVAALDVDKVHWPLQVKLADGTERYETFGGDIEHPEAGEVSFVDAQGQAHARRWTHRQSGLSAIRPQTQAVLIVIEAVHADARRDADALGAALGDAIEAAWSRPVSHGQLNRDTAHFGFG